MTRSELLQIAEKAVNGDREQDYGSPENNFETIGLMWSVYLRKAKPDINLAVNDIAPKDVAVMLILLKTARIASGHAKADNWVDLAGYAACGGEIESIGEKNNER